MALTDRPTLTADEKAELLAKLRARADRREREWQAREAALEQMRAEAEEREANRDHAAEAAVRIAAARPRWQRDALCREYPDLPWFPERGETGAEAKAVCARCLAIDECRAYVLRNDIKFGVWAGEVASKLHKST